MESWCTSIAPYEHGNGGARDAGQENAEKSKNPAAYNSQDGVQGWRISAIWSIIRAD
jgi:hypothetical protein